MQKPSPTQQKSLALALVVAAMLAVSFFFGDNTMMRELLSDEGLSANHIEESSRAAESAGTVSDGLRHEVPAALQAATVVRVIDGDTLKVRVGGPDVGGPDADSAAAGGSEETVRLIGINTPESVAPDESRNTEEGVAASRYMCTLVSPGDTVYLQRDTSDTDDYGRLLRYVWLERPGSLKGMTDPESVRTKMLNAAILDAGYAVAHKYKPNDAYFELFKSYQLDALHEERGLWARGLDWAQGI